MNRRIVFVILIALLTSCCFPGGDANQKKSLPQQQTNHSDMATLIIIDKSKTPPLGKDYDFNGLQPGAYTLCFVDYYHNMAVCLPSGSKTNFLYILNIPPEIIKTWKPSKTLVIPRKEPLSPRAQDKTAHLRSGLFLHSLLFKYQTIF